MPLKVFTKISEVKEWVREIKRVGRTIGLVPTMGALHEGHLSLVRRAKEKTDAVIVSVFVNPTQFGPNEDYDAYPRTFAEDCNKLEQVQADAVFHPDPVEMYPAGYATYVNIEGTVTEVLCSARRPGHFRGVATVVMKLMHIVEADRAFFGQKDAQQVVVIRQFAGDLNLNVEIEMVPIVRATDGLALSSRNQYLSTQERQAALILSTALRKAKMVYENGERDAAVLKQMLVDTIQTEKIAQIDYVEVYRFPELKEIASVEEQAIAALAVRFGGTRLIDNAIFGGNV